MPVSFAQVQSYLADENPQYFGQIPQEIGIPVIDSRACTHTTPTWFVALVGEKTDGHHYVKTALQNGATVALVARTSELVKNVVTQGNPDHFALIAVDDPEKALQKIARAFVREQNSQRDSNTDLNMQLCRRVTITGSNGKTSTKELVAAALREGYREIYERSDEPDNNVPVNVLATVGNLNNHLGVPMTVLRATGQEQAWVVEMGMNHLGEIAFLCDLCPPEVALVTNIGMAHAGNVGGPDGVEQAKGEMFDALPPTGIAIVNADDERCCRAAKRAKCAHLFFGRTLPQKPETREQIYYMIDDTSAPEGGTYADFIWIDDEGHVFDTAKGYVPFDGAHNVGNAAGAVATAMALGLSFRKAVAGLAHAQVSGGRLRRKTARVGAIVLDDSYNANPDSMAAGLRTLVDISQQNLTADGKERRRIAVLGEMRELGDYSREGHLAVGRLASAAGVAWLFICGEEGRAYGEGAILAGFDPTKVVWAPSSADLAPLVDEQIQSGDAVLIKGSRGAQTEKVVQRLVE